MSDVPPKDPPTKDPLALFEEDASLRGGNLRLPQDILDALQRKKVPNVDGWEPGHFQPVECLGKGGFGLVVKATHKASRHMVALKCIKIRDQSAVADVSRECTIHMNAQHPNK